MEAQVRADVAAIGDLDGARSSMAEVAYSLARQLDQKRVTASWLIAAKLIDVLKELDVSVSGRGESVVDQLAERRAAHIAASARASGTDPRPDVGS